MRWVGRPRGQRDDFPSQPTATEQRCPRRGSACRAASVRNPLSASRTPGRPPAVARAASSIGTNCALALALVPRAVATMKPSSLAAA
jgi:hypothetical protein